MSREHPLPHNLRPISRERARAIVARGRESLRASNLRQYLTSDEEAAVARFWRQSAPGSWSFNDVIRECAR